MKTTKKKGVPETGHKLKVLKIFAIVLVLLVIAAGLCVYINWRKDISRLNEAMIMFNTGNFEQGLEKCRAIRGMKERGFCYSYCLGLKLGMIDRYYADDSEKQQQMQKEYALVCGYDSGNPYMTRMCSGLRIS